jgi:hypothetical protein
MVEERLVGDFITIKIGGKPVQIEATTSLRRAVELAYPQRCGRKEYGCGDGIVRRIVSEIAAELDWRDRITQDQK